MIDLLREVKKRWNHMVNTYKKQAELKIR